MNETSDTKPIRRGIFITGTSSGIGRALALELAGPEVVLGLAARRLDRLQKLAKELEARGAGVRIYPLDVKDGEKTRNAIDDFHRQTDGLDMVIANSGIGLAEGLYRGDSTPMNEVIAVNLQGAINTLAPAIPHMVERKRGQLVAIGSVAGYLGLPGKGAYCASKAALKTIMDAYRPALRPYGIRVTTISPGWVVSELTEKNRYRMPFLMETERAARLIVRALAKGKSNYVFPWQMRLIIPLLQRMPDRLLPIRA